MFRLNLPSSPGSPDPGVLLATGSGIFSIAIARDALIGIGVNLPNYFFLGCAYGGFIFVVAGVAISVLGRSLVHVSDIVSFGDANYVEEVAKENDISLIHEFASQIFGSGGISDLRKMEKWYKVNPNIFFKIYEVRTKPGLETRTLVGYYCILPMTARAIELLDEEEVNGTSFTSEHIRSKRASGPPRAIYIGGIAALGRNRRAKAATLKLLHQHLELEYKRGIKSVYARPTTDEGLRLLVEGGFRPVIDPRDHGLLKIYRLDAPAN